MRIDALKLAAALALAAPAAFVGTPAHAAGGLQDCAYVPRTSDDMETFPACASFAPSGALRLRPQTMAQLRFVDGLASVAVGKLFYYVARDGRSAPVARVDDAPALFHDGLATSPRRVGGHYKVGYIDRGLNLVIPARYDGGLDFSDGRAQVCRGCTVDRDGEMAEMQGGLWGCIDTHGREVVPVTQPSPDGLDCSRAGG
jgi:hypothetical protein